MKKEANKKDESSDSSAYIPKAGRLVGRALGQYDTETLKKYHADVLAAVSQKGITVKDTAPESQQVFDMVGRELEKRLAVK